MKNSIELNARNVAGVLTHLMILYTAMSVHFERETSKKEQNQIIPFVARFYFVFISFRGKLL